MAISIEPKPVSASAARETVARVHDLSDDHCVASWGAFLFVIWRRETTLEGAARLRDALRRQSAMNPQGIALFTIIEASAPAPSAEVRNALADLLADFGKAIKFSAVAFEGSGFRAALVRGVVTGLTMLARMPYPHRVFASTDEASHWLTGSLHERYQWTTTAVALSDAVIELRSRVRNG